MNLIGPGGVSVGVSGLVINFIAACGKARNGGYGQRPGTRMANCLGNFEAGYSVST